MLTMKSRPSAVSCFRLVDDVWPSSLLSELNAELVSSLHASASTVQNRPQFVFVIGKFGPQQNSRFCYLQLHNLTHNDYAHVERWKPDACCATDTRSTHSVFASSRNIFSRQPLGQSMHHLWLVAFWRCTLAYADAVRGGSANVPACVAYVRWVVFVPLF